MKTTNKLIITAAIAITIISLGTISVSAYKGDLSVTGPNYSPERHEAMLNAFANNDYNAWKELMNNKGRVTELITADNFARFSETHKLASEGKFEEAKAIRTELGLGMRNGFGRNAMGKHRNNNVGRGLRDGSGTGCNLIPNAKN